MGLFGKKKQKVYTKEESHELCKRAWDYYDHYKEQKDPVTFYNLAKMYEKGASLGSIKCANAALDIRVNGIK